MISDHTNAGPQHTLQVKIMYWGPGEAGKTTNFHRLMEIFKPYRISKGFSIATTDARTLWSDAAHFRFLLGQFNLELVVHVATTTGQERFLSTREYVLQNADGVIFVGDSHPDKQEENLRSFEELTALTQCSNIPILIQLNKRDLKNAIDDVEFLKLMGLPEVECDPNGFRIIYPSIAIDKRNPVGVKEIFLDLVQRVLRYRMVS